MRATLSRGTRAGAREGGARWAQAARAEPARQLHHVGGRAQARELARRRAANPPAPAPSAAAPALTIPRFRCRQQIPPLAGPRRQRDRPTGAARAPHGERPSPNPGAPATLRAAPDRSRRCWGSNGVCRARAHAAPAVIRGAPRPCRAFQGSRPSRSLATRLRDPSPPPRSSFTSLSPHPPHSRRQAALWQGSQVPLCPALPGAPSPAGAVPLPGHPRRAR